MPLSKYILDANEKKVLDAQMRNKWMIKIRWFYLILLVGVAVATTLAAKAPTSPISIFLGVGLVGLAVNFLLFLLVRIKSDNIRYYRITGLAQVFLDVGLASYVIYTQGLYSRATLLYAIPILAGGLIFLNSFSYYAASLATFCYGAVLFLYIENHPYFHSLKDMVVPLVFYGSVMFVLAMIVSYFNRINVESTREESYTQLLSLMRHQLHHPSGVIAALVDVLEHSDAYEKFTNADKNHLRLIKHENQAIENMVTNLLETIENPTGDHNFKKEDINLINIIEEAAQSCAISMNRESDLIVNYPIKSLVIKGQEQQLRVAFSNLIDNAFRYSEAGTKVEVTVNEHEPIVEIIIEDHGKGINSDQLKKLIRRFSHFDGGDSESSVYSMGLGLYVSRTIIERHGGKLGVKSHPGKGTIVTVKLAEKGSPNEKN